jgi:putative redox protein
LTKFLTRGRPDGQLAASRAARYGSGMGRIAHVVATSSTGFAQQIRAGRHTLLADEPATSGGTDSGPSPYQLLLAGLAACTSITLRMYAARKGWELGEVEVDLSLSKEGEHDVIRREVRCSAPLAEEKRARLLEIAEKTPVTKTLKQGARIETQLRAGAT